MNLHFIGRVISKTVLFLLFIMLLLQIPLKGKSIMNHYLDETDNKFFHTIGNFINGFKKGFTRRNLQLTTKPENINVDSLIQSKELSNIFLLQEEINTNKKVKENDIANRKKEKKLVKSRIPKKLTSPQLQGEYHSAEDEKRLKEILMSE